MSSWKVTSAPFGPTSSFATHAFFAFSFAASSAYIINDLLDLPGDRDHHSKRKRPFAAAMIPIPRGILMSAGLMALAIVLATINVVGGFLVTDRMLAMFGSKKKGGK